jgi:hypothetical protein
MYEYNKNTANARHKKFQLGTNPMEMSAFENSLVIKEQMERRKHRTDYIKGVQGRDGGTFPSDDRPWEKIGPP